MKSLRFILKSLLIDFKRLIPGVKGLDRDLVTIEARLKNEGYGFLTIALPSFGKAFDKGLDEGRMTVPHGFEKIHGGSLPKFLSGLTCHVFDAKTGELKENCAVDVVKCIRELLFLFKKLNLSADQEEILDSKAKFGFFSHDSSIRPLSSDRLDYFGRVCSLLLPNLDDFEDLDCKHGPGAVFEGCSPNQKWSGVYHGLSDFDHRLMGIGYDLNAFALRPFSNTLGPQICSSGVFAKLISVPKSSTSRRTITVEPLLMQFVQQGLNSHLRESIRKDKILSLSLALDDQGPNQKLALDGSRTRKYATLDLSSASDLLSLDLVKFVFSKRPRFLDLALGCRSIGVSSKPDEILKKFAGMGNALTFPVQSVVFATIAIAAIAFKEGKYPSYWNLRRIASNVRVYGDDIIVHTDCYHQVVDWLTHFGLKVNQSKSFFKGNFRESCGVDAFRGYDVTPLYLRHEPEVTSITANAIENFVSISNQAWLKGLYSFSTSLSTIVERAIRKRLPLVGKKSSCLGWHTRLDAWNFQRWNSTLHRFEVRSLVGFSSKRKDPLDDYAALLKFYHVPLLGRPAGHLEHSDRRFTLKHRLRWVHAT